MLPLRPADAAGAPMFMSGRDQVLDRTAQMTPDIAESEGSEQEAVRGRVGLRSLARGAWQFFVTLSFSSLTRRIVFLNVTGLLALVIGIFYLSQLRAGLIDARVQDLVE